MAKVASKNKSDTEQWITLGNDKKVYISDVSIWTLLVEDEEYTISYKYEDSKERNTLTSIVTKDFVGQF